MAQSVSRLRLRAAGWDRAVRGIRRAFAGGLLRRFAGSALDLLYPPHCVVCGTELPPPVVAPCICSPCRLSFQPETTNLCPRCGMPIRGAGGLGSIGRARSGPPARSCPGCRDCRFPFDAVLALGVYRGQLREVVLQMKRTQQEPLTLAMGQMVAQALTAAGATADLIVPVPMHWSRHFLREINQAELLARAISRKLGTPMRRDLLRCRRKTKKQGTLGPAERARNLRGAFRLALGRKISGATILIVDDVMTTGATVSEAARVCRRAGAAGVLIAVVARGVGVEEFPPVLQ